MNITPISKKQPEPGSNLAKWLGWAAVFLLLSRATGWGQSELPLTVSNLSFESGAVEFDLTNRADKPMTAWSLDIKMKFPDGGESSIWMNEDVFLTLGLDPSLIEERNRASHQLGGLLPGKVRHVKQFVDKAAIDAVVTVTSVIFADTTSLGDASQTNHLMEVRSVKSRELVHWLNHFTMAKNSAKGMGSLKDLQKSLETHVPPATSYGGRSDLQKVANTTRESLRDLVQQTIKAAEVTNQDPQQLLTSLTALVKAQAEAASQHVAGGK